MKSPLFLSPPGIKGKRASLKSAKGTAFADFLHNSAGEAFGRLVEVRRVDGPSSGDCIVMDVQVERPQKVVHPILREERIAVVFFDSDEGFPEVLALRSDFPNVPHTNLRDAEFPRNLCLYDQPYENVKLDWTAARFLNRIRYWLQHTATGTLHGEDQPLEPLLLASNQRLILPGDYSLTDLKAESGLLQVTRCAGPENELTLVARRHESNQNGNAEFVATIFSCKEQTHGVIKYQPQTLEQLHDLCADAGLDLAKDLAAKAKGWLLDKPTKEIRACKLIIILLLPKKRRDGTHVETVEQWAFLTKTVEEVGVALGVFARGGGASSLLIGAPPVTKANLTRMPLVTLQVVHGLSPDRAAAMNGALEVKAPVFAIGMGALGSQVFNNLIRAGFGRWTLTDPDILLPHNCARHFLGEWALGQNKAEAMAHVANAILDQPKEGLPIARSLPADFLKPGKHREAMESNYNAAELVLDLSASVAVSRQCASSNAKARHIAAFLNPSGNSLIVTAEDSNRTYRLDWLEMLHYRAVLEESSLRTSLQPPDGRFRYGNSCRDVSLQLAQDDAAIWAGTASKAIRHLRSSDKAKVQIFFNTDAGGISVIEPPILPLIEVQFGTWTVRFDKCLLDKLSHLRGLKLPNETGGVMLGHFDTQRNICSIVEIVASPPDSQEWPTSYIRGCKGLQEKVREAENTTLDQISYVGEWHSHPKGAAVRPSDDDWKAYSWLSEKMVGESLPGIMLIIGDDQRFCFVGTTASPATLRRERRGSVRGAIVQ